MDIKSLKSELEANKVPEDLYYFLKDEGFPNEAFCLVENGNKYEVYYSERGYKRGLKQFDTEDAACRYLRIKLLVYYRKI